MAPRPDPVLEVRSLALTYPLRDQQGELVALERIDLTVQRGEFVAIVGPSGCGKSSLLSVICGLSPASSGEVYVAGQPVRSPHPAIGMIFQEDSTFPWRTTLGNVEFGLEMRGVPRHERRRRSLEALALVGLRGFESRYPAELSGGMRQRVAIARTLVLEPEILLMDEPFGALDEQTRLLLGEELLRIQQQLRQTVVFVTHNLQEAVHLADRVVVMTARPGRIKAEVPVTLPRPRDSTVVGSPEFAGLVGRAWSLLREEALRSFQASMEQAVPGRARLSLASGE